MKRSWHVHALLFILTVCSTYYAGIRGFSPYFGSSRGLVYSFSVMAILLSHEMVTTSRAGSTGYRRRCPIFIPFPSPLRHPGRRDQDERRDQGQENPFDIGIAGPLCGFILAVPCVFIGAKLSVPMKIPAAGDALIMGEPLLLKLAEWVMVGNLPTGFDLLIHPIGYAGWVGLFITALNLLPIGQLDGGHILYGVFGEKRRAISRALIPLLVLLAIFYNVGWFVLVALLLIFGIGHPHPLDAETPLDGKRRILAIVMLFVFAVSFVPAPFAGTSLITLIRGLL